MEKKKEYKLPESLVIEMFNFLATFPAVRLTQQIQMTINRQIEESKKKELKRIIPNKEQKNG